MQNSAVGRLRAQVVGSGLSSVTVGVGVTGERKYTGRHRVGATQTPTPSAVEGEAGNAPASPLPSPAFAPPPGNPRFPLFDGLRGIAALAILVFHDSELTGRVGLGVPGRAAEVLGSFVPILFFVISGFLLYRPYVWARACGRAMPSTWRYARRRALRILPAYWIALTLLAVYPGLPGVFTGDWWRYYGYLQLYSTRTLGNGIAVAWTLCVEVTFYIALPFWAMASRRIPAGRGPRELLRAELVPLAAIALAGAGVQLAGARHLIAYPLSVSIAGQCTWLALGMALAVLSAVTQLAPDLAQGWRVLAARPGLCWLGSAAAFGGLVALVPSGGLFGLIGLVQTRQPVGTTLLRMILEAIAVTLLVAPAVFGETRAGWPRRLLGSAPLLLVGVVSYSFYLWHLSIAEQIALPRSPGSSYAGFGLGSHLHFAPTAVLYVVTLAAVLVVAAVSYRVVELPFLRRKETSRTYPPTR